MLDKIPTHLILEKILHDMANPLGNTHNFLSLLQEQTGGSDDAQEITDLAVNASQDMLMVFQQLRFVFGPSETSSNLSADTFTDHLKRYLKRHKIELTFKNSPELDDKNHLFQLLIIIAGAAPEFLPLGGQLSFKITDNDIQSIQFTGIKESFNADLIQAFTRTPPLPEKDLSYNTVLAYFAGLAIAQQNLTCTAQQTKTRITFMLESV